MHHTHVEESSLHGAPDTHCRYVQSSFVGCISAQCFGTNGQKFWLDLHITTNFFQKFSLKISNVVVPHSNKSTKMTVEGMVHAVLFRATTIRRSIGYSPAVAKAYTITKLLFVERIPISLEW